MDTETSFERILADVGAEHRAWMGLMGRLSPEEATARPKDGWSAVDALVHVTAWKENAAKVARLQAEPGAAEIDPNQGSAGALGINVDAFNAEVFEAHRDWAPERAVAWSEQIHRELLSALSALPEERLLGGRGRHGARRWCSLPAMSHPREHLNEVERQLGDV